MINYICTPLVSELGVQRDGTAYSSNNYISAQWTRFYQGQARSIGGYKCVDYGTTGIIRDMFAVPTQQVDVYLGRADSLQYVALPTNNIINVNAIFEIDRTPPDLVVDLNNTWSFDLYTTIEEVLYPKPQIIAQAAPNANSINNHVEQSIFYGDITTTAPLATITDATLGPIQCSGGIVFISPLLVAYGNNGQIRWNDPNAMDPLQTWTTGTGHTPLTAIIANTKIVYGAASAGASVPTGLFWSINQLIRATYTPITDPTTNVTTYTFSHTVIDTISIISASSIVSYQQTYFWVGQDNFYMYDGVVRPIPNEINRRWFFDNINLQYSNKIFGVVNTAYNEIWWYAPFGDSTENDTVIIYSIDTQTFFDSKNARSCGIQTSLFPKPLLADSNTTQINTRRRGSKNVYLLWEHETGTDQVIDVNTVPIIKSFAHHFVDLCSQAGSQNRQLRNRRIETDFKITGNMTVSITNLNYASDYYNGNAIIEGPYPFNQSTQYIDTASQGRLVSLNFESNDVGGSFQAGKTLYDWEIGDVQT